jgi:N-acetylglutamate synthase-like GNAT family acetyltransferase
MSEARPRILFHHNLLIRQQGLPRAALLSVLPEARILNSLEGEEAVEDVLETEDLCWGLRPSYVDRALHQCDVALITVAAEDAYMILGVTAFRVSGDQMDVELLCSNPAFGGGMGRHLVACLTSFQRVLRLRHIRLCSSPVAVAFYQHMGFTEDDKHMCPSANLTPMKRGGSRKRAQCLRLRRVLR